MSLRNSHLILTAFQNSTEQDIQNNKKITLYKNYLTTANNVKKY